MAAGSASTLSFGSLASTAVTRAVQIRRNSSCTPSITWTSASSGAGLTSVVRNAGAAMASPSEVVVQGGLREQRVQSQLHVAPCVLPTIGTQELIRVEEAGTPEIAAGKPRPRQLGLEQVGAPQVGTAQVGPDQPGAAQVSARKIGAPEIGPREVQRPQRGSGEGRAKLRIHGAPGVPSGSP